MNSDVPYYVVMQIGGDRFIKMARLATQSNQPGQ